MRIHEILEACVEYVAIDGVIGTDAQTLLLFLQSKDPSIDLDFFTYLWPYLVDHHAIQLILTTHPLPSPDGHVDLGSAPLPADYDPNVTGDASAVTGLRGRAAAMTAQGREYQTDRETMAANKEAKRLKAAQRYKPKPPPLEDQQQLLRFLDDDDGGDGEDRVQVSDFARLVEKWGSRLRIRATDQEIYFRLTGSHDRVGKITALVLHALQLSARSREKGITALELAPTIETTQGSLHHYMKTLTSMGLCVKVPYVRHSTVTNILLFHQFMNENHIYQAAIRESAASTLTVPASAVDQSSVVDEDEDEDDAMADDDEDAASTQQPEDGWNLDFPLLRADEIYAGHEVRERLIRILDHPNLKNHLLKATNLLHLLGWKGPHTVRQRRGVAKQVNVLSNAGVLDVLIVGEQRTRCLRLKKYDPDYVAPLPNTEATPMSDATLEMIDDHRLVEAHNLPFEYVGQTVISLPLDFQLNDIVKQTGLAGSTLKNIRNQLDGFHKRALEFHFKRCEVAWTPPQLRDRHITQVMDTVGRERRLKTLTLEAYRHYMLSHGLPVDDAKFPPLTDEIGHWQPVDNRGLWDDISFFNQVVHMQYTNETAKPSHKIPKPKPSKAPSAKRSRKSQATLDSTTPLDVTVPSETEEEEPGPARKRQMKYEVASQVRGRPRKYIYVVNEQGDVNRKILDNIFPVEGLSPIWVWIADKNVLVPAPSDYFGSGPPPAFSAEYIAQQGKKRQWFDQFDSKEKREGKDTSTKGGSGAKSRASSKATGIRNVNRAPDIDNATQAGPSTNAIRVDMEVDELDNDSQQKSAEMKVGQAESTGVENPAVSSMGTDSRAAAPKELAQAARKPLPSSNDPDSANKANSVPLAGKVGRPSKYTAQELAYPSTVRSSDLPLHSPTSVAPSTTDRADSSAPTIAQPTLDEASEVLDTELLPVGRRQHPLYAAMASTKASKRKIPTWATVGTAAGEPEVGSMSSVPSAKRQKGRQSGLSEIPAHSDTATMPQTAEDAARSELPSEYYQMWRQRDKLKPESPRGTTPHEATSEPVEAAMSVARMDDAHAHVYTQGSQETSSGNLMRQITEFAEGRPSAPTMTPAEPDQCPATSSDPPKTRSARRGRAAKNAVSSAIPAQEVLQTPKTRQDTPLVEVEPSDSAASVRKPQPSRAQAARFDMGTIRRMAELCQALIDAGGVMEVVKLLNFHTNWVKEYAGTDHPNAPLINATMDRTVFKRTINQLVDGGRIKSTKVAVPTMTGRNLTVEIVSTLDVSKADFQAYVRRVQSETAATFTGKRPVRQQIESTEFTEIVVEPTKPIVPVKTTRAALRPKTARTAQEPNVDPSVDLSPENRRGILLKDQVVTPAILGVHSGKIARIATMHQTIVSSFNTAKDNVISRSPRIFSLELLFTEIPIGKWYQCVSSTRHTDELEAYLLDANTNQTKMRDVPANVRLYQSWGGYGNKEKLRKLLQAMVLLKLIRPLDAVDEVEAELVATDASGFTSGFRNAAQIGTAMFFQLYEYAPVYHIAVDLANFLGVVPVATGEQAQQYWDILKRASLNQDDNAIPSMPRVTPAPLSIAPYEATFEVEDHVQFTKALRARSRWVTETPLLDLQKTAIDTLFQPGADMARLDSGEFLKAFAREWAIHIDHLRTRIDHILGKSGPVQLRTKRKEEEQQRKAQEVQRKERAEAEFQAKLREFTRAGEMEWDRRVDEASQRTKVQRSPALDKYLLVLSLSALKRGPFTDEALDAGCLSFERILSGNDKGQAKPAMFRKSLKKATKAPKVKKPIAQGRPLTRNRRHWYEEEDLQLIYGEAIIRGRARGKPGFPGRVAMSQLFGETSNQVLLNRLKKMWELPGRKAFYERLIDVYVGLRAQHQGSSELPDPNPESMTEFDLKAHIAFLQSKMPMDARTLSVENNLSSLMKTEDLPLDYASFVDAHTWDVSAIPVPTLATVWELGGDDMRVNAINTAPLLDQKPVVVATGSADVSLEKLKALIKTVARTENEDYIPAAGEELVKPFSNEAISRANNELIAEKVIRKQRMASEGRVYSLNGSWVQAAQSQYLDHMSYQAEKLQSLLNDAAAKNGYIQWNLLAKGGEIASLLNMVSNGEIEFRVDMRQVPTLKSQNWRNTYNTRALNDAEIEFPLKIRRTTSAVVKPSAQHPSIYHCSAAPCWHVENDMPDAQVVSEAVQIIRGAGSNGITRVDIQGQLNLDDVASYALFDALGTQEVFWAGYDTARLVHKLHWSSWAIYFHEVDRDAMGMPVKLKSARGRWAVPRKWTTLYGDFDEDEWERSMNFVLASIVSRPGITERCLRTKIGNLHDRLELNEVLRYLLDSGVVQREPIIGTAILPPIEATVAEEETNIAWWANTKILWH